MARPARHPVVDALIQAVDPGPGPVVLPRALVETPVEEVLAISDAHRVQPALARMLNAAPDAPRELVEALAPLRTEQLVHHLSALADLAVVGAALDAAGIRWAVVKGPVATLLWPAPDMRDYRDVDLLVEPSRWADAIEVLHEVGADQLDLAWGLIRRQERAELTFVSDNALILDLHWHLVNDTALRRRLRWPTGDALGRRRYVEVGSAQVPTLDPLDTLLHLAYHCTHSGGYRLLWLADVAHAWSAIDDPAEVVARAEAARLDTLVRVALDRVATVFGTRDRPDLPWTSRRGSAWRAMLRAADRRTPAPRPVASGPTGRALVESTDVGTTWSALRLVGRAAAHPLRSGRDRTVDNPLHRPDGDEASRRAYLRTVVRQP